MRAHLLFSFHSDILDTLLPASLFSCYEKEDLTCVQGNEGKKTSCHMHTFKSHASSKQSVASISSLSLTFVSLLALERSLAVSLVTLMIIQTCCSHLFGHKIRYFMQKYDFFFITTRTRQTSQWYRTISSSRNETKLKNNTNHHHMPWNVVLFCSR